MLGDVEETIYLVEEEEEEEEEEEVKVGANPRISFTSAYLKPCDRRSRSNQRCCSSEVSFQRDG